MRASAHVRIVFDTRVKSRGGSAKCSRVRRPTCNKPLRDVCNRVQGKCTNSVMPGDVTCGQCHSYLVECNDERCRFSRKGTLYCGVHGTAR